MSKTSSCLQSSVGASILNCNFVKIKQELEELIQAGIDFVHLDVMDGNFVDDITFGPSFVTNLIKEFPGVTFEVHMMVKQPMKFILPMSNAGVKRYIFHYEVTKNNDQHYDHSVEEIVQEIKLYKMEAALAINPDTPVETISVYIGLVDSILIMTVRPGRGGQKFISSMMSKVEFLRKNYGNYFDIELDGGVGPVNIDICGSSGANRVVCGSALLNSKQKSIDVVSMREALFPTH